MEPQPVSSYPLPISGPDEFLKPSLYIQSDDPGLAQMAKEIVGETRDGVKAARRLLSWVYENIEKSPTASAPSAVEVLKNRRGDCNEHAMLYAALCRAVGIPCQIIVGLVCMDHAFYYHAWNKVYLGRWISVDPTFGQFPADATHLKLKQGELEEQAKVLKVVGNIKIKVLEYR
jgi:transglutaminase-like putative cysteine protease